MLRDISWAAAGLIVAVGFMNFSNGLSSYLADKNEIEAETQRSKCMRELQLAVSENRQVDSTVWINTCADIKSYRIKDRRRDSYLE